MSSLNEVPPHLIEHDKVRDAIANALGCSNDVSPSKYTLDDMIIKITMLVRENALLRSDIANARADNHNTRKLRDDCAEKLGAAVEALEAERKRVDELVTAGFEKPIPMRLTCPLCGELHVDEGDFAMKPHHTHACQSCGMVWRPAKVDTVGVRFLPGYKDEP